MLNKIKVFALNFIDSIDRVLIHCLIDNNLLKVCLFLQYFFDFCNSCESLKTYT